MKKGIVLTDALDLAWLAQYKFDVIKVITGWGMSWTTQTCQAVMRMTDTVIVRSIWGDPSYSKRLFFNPIATGVLEEFRLWWDAHLPGKELLFQVGNEPLIYPEDDETSAWEYLWHLDETEKKLRQRYPGIKLIAPAHMVNHHVRLGQHAYGQERWNAIGRAVLSRFDHHGLNAYTSEQLATGVALLKDLPPRPIWITEFNLNEDCGPAEKGRRIRNVLESFAKSSQTRRIEGCTLYHVVARPGCDPMHFNPNYTVEPATLETWRNPMKVEWTGMSRNCFTPGPRTIRGLVMHATAGRWPSDFEWLRKGGDPSRPVSCHYYITKQGRIFQYVRDEDAAWHAGVSSWTFDGKVVNNINGITLGIELENLNNGVDPYPNAQLDAAVALCRHLVQKYNIPQAHMMRHLDCSPGRKTDPAGLDWAWFQRQVFCGDLFAGWGAKVPLSAEQRGWLIPQTWLKNQKLGQAVTPEIYPVPEFSFQGFEHGLIYYYAKGDVCHVILFAELSKK